MLLVETILRVEVEDHRESLVAGVGNYNILLGQPNYGSGPALNLTVTLELTLVFNTL